VIITRENLQEEASNLNDEILNLEKKYGVNIIALAQVESLDTEEESDYLVMANRVSLDRCVNSVVHLVQTAQEGFGIKPEMFFAEAIKRTVTNERAFYVEMMKLVDKLIESIQSGKELSTELEGDMIELLKALKAERNDAGSKKNLYN
jgi:hypothetical protein